MISVILDKGNAPARTGIGIYSEAMMHTLQQYCADSLEVSEAGISWPGHSLRPLRRIVYLARLERLIIGKFRGARIVHFLNQYVPRRSEGVRYVVTIHDLDPMLMPEAHTWRYSFYFRQMIGRSVERAHLIVTHSETVRSELLEYFSLDPAKIVLGGDGIGPKFIELADGIARTTPKVPTLLYVGQLSKKKNVAWTIRAVTAGVRSGRLPPMKFLLAGGRGHGFDEIQRELAKSEDVSQWLERPSLSEIVKLYSSCSAVILPSRREGLGRPLLEAMYCEKPIVASRIPSSIEMAGDGAAYFSLDSPDELYTAVREAFAGRHMEALRSVASVKLARYSWEHLAGVYKGIYEQALCKD